MAGTILMWLAVIGFIIANQSFKKQRYESEKQYWKMKYSLDEAKQKEAQQQINHTRYGK